MMMMMRKVAALWLLLVFTAAGNAAQPRRGKAGPRSAGRPNPIDKQVDFAALEKKLAQWKPVKVTFDSEKLTPREVKLVSHLVNACHYMEDIFWGRAIPRGLRCINRCWAAAIPKTRSWCACCESRAAAMTCWRKTNLSLARNRCHPDADSILRELHTSSWSNM